MTLMVRRIAQILSLFVFLLLLIVGIFSREDFALVHLPIIVLKAFIGYVIFWLLGIVVSDILLKAVLHSMEDQAMEEWEGGLLSRFIPDKNDELKKINTD
ncbi:MAG: hypothetical protein A2293_04550 [Elusimicrobia bacterium RIFOXYB2_FULL_49_7]|nr:MAG: hypothetical protein A2293_04550 [Elusimicrobia bacterium RIFOXYB2_FULL_49_7]